MGDSIENILSVTIGPFLSQLQGMAGTFLGTGYTFITLAITLAVIGSMYSWWTSGSIEDLVSNGVRAIIVLAPLLMLFAGWSDYMTKFENFFMKDLPQHIGASGGSPYEVVGKSIQKIMDAVNLSQGAEAGTDKGWWDKLWDSLSMKTLYSLILTAIVFILNCLLAFALIFAVFMPLAGLYIGAIFGPLILAWIPWRPLADMTARWTSFMIANGITFVVSIVIINALGKSIGYLTSTLGKMSEDSVGAGLAGWAVTLVALFAIYLFATNLLLQANNIAQGMTGGAAVGEGLFGKLTAAASAGGMLGAGRATANLHKAAVQGAAKASAKAPGAIGAVADAAGKAAQGAGLSRAIDGKSGGAALAGAGNLLRAASAPFNKAQRGIDVAGKKVSSILDRAKDNVVYKELDRPIGKEPPRKG